MRSARGVAMAVVPPVVYLALVYWGTRPPKPAYRAVAPTVLTVSDKGGPVALHAPPAIYPEAALQRGVEGVVTVKVKAGIDGRVVEAVAVAGPVALWRAAEESVSQWQFEAKAQEAEVEVRFSVASATRSVELPLAVRRYGVRYAGKLRGTVRLVVLVNEQGRAEFVQAVSGAGELAEAATDSVRRWGFRPMMRNGKVEAGTAVIEVAVGQ